MPAPKKVDRDEFTRLNNQGFTIKQLADHFNITPRTVSKLRAGLGITSPNSRALTPETLATIEGMIDDGASFKEINRTTGVSMETLARRYPGRQWTIEQANDYRATIRTLQPRIRRTYGRQAA